MLLKLKQVIWFTLVLCLLFIFFYFIKAPSIETNIIFLTTATFLFAIFTGFFISRQSFRHENVRKNISGFDGHITSVFRSSGILGNNLQQKFSEILKSHYQIIINKKQWDYHINHKSNTLKVIREALDQIGDQKFESVQNAVLGQIEWSLRDMQVLRKNMVSLYQERIPFSQWVLLIVLAVILIATIITMPSYLVILQSLLKAAFVTAIIIVLFLIDRLDRMKLFEKAIGLSSAQDIIDILDDKK